VKLSTCPLCQDDTLSALFLFQDTLVVRCSDCGLVMLNPQPNDEALATIYGEQYFIGSDQDELRDQGNALKRGTAKLQLAEISTYMDASQPLRMLEVGCGLGNFLFEAQQMGFEVQGIDVSPSAVASANETLGTACVRSGHLDQAGFDEASFDIIVLADVIEHVRDPKAFLKHVRTLIKPGGALFVAVPSLDSLSARLMGRHWMEYKREHLFYFNRQTIQRLITDCGFENLTVTPGKKVLSLGYIIGHFEKFPVPILTPLMKTVGWVLPQSTLTAPLRVVASGINVMARAPKGK